METSSPDWNHFDFNFILNWISEHPFIGLLIIFYLSTTYISIKRDKSFWQVWFNGKTPRWAMRKKHRNRLKPQENTLKENSKKYHPEE